MTYDYTNRLRIMRELVDLGRKARTYDDPWGSHRNEARKCSYCRQMTYYTTNKGRSVCPACEGFTDMLTADGWGRLIFMLQDRLPVAGMSEEGTTDGSRPSG